MAHELHIGNWGVLSGRHDQVMRNATDKHQLTWTYSSTTPEDSDERGSISSIEITHHRQPFTSSWASSMDRTWHTSTTSCESHYECLSIEALTRSWSYSWLAISWYWTIMIPTHSNTITQHLYYVTFCHHSVLRMSQVSNWYSFSFWAYWSPRKLSREQHCPLTNLRYLDFLSFGCCRMLPDEIKPKNPMWVTRDPWVGSKCRCTSVWEISQQAENTVRKVRNQGGNMMLLLFTVRYIFVEFQQSWSKDRAAWKEFVLVGTNSLLVRHLYQASYDNHAHRTVHRAAVNIWAFSCWHCSVGEGVLHSNRLNLL